MGWTIKTKFGLQAYTTNLKIGIWTFSSQLHTFCLHTVWKSTRWFEPDCDSDSESVVSCCWVTFASWERNSSISAFAFLERCQFFSYQRFPWTFRLHSVPSSSFVHFLRIQLYLCQQSFHQSLSQLRITELNRPCFENRTCCQALQFLRLFCSLTWCCRQTGGWS